MSSTSLASSGLLANSGNLSCEDAFAPMPPLFALDDAFNITQSPLDFDNLYQQSTLSPPNVVPNNSQPSLTPPPTTAVPSSQTNSRQKKKE